MTAPATGTSASRAVASDLSARLGSERVRADEASLTAYAVDAGIYRIRPTAVVLAQQESDIEQTIRYARERGIPVTPRAAGTNLTGSAIGTGIILDVSPMRRILEVNPDERRVRVQPGIVYAELNQHLARHGLLFGPDPSSGDMCKLGGMLANNSSGPHTLRYGSVKDNVEALRLYLPESGWLDARAYALNERGVDDVWARHPALKSLIASVLGHGEMIRARRPTVSKNSAGYNVFGLLDGLERGVADFPKLFVGSEGTLGVISEATLRLVERPARITTAVIHFRFLEDVGEAVSELLACNPTALEIMDAHTLTLIGRERHGIPADAAATLLAEFDGAASQTGEVDDAKRVAEICGRYRLAGPPVMASDPERREELWKARKALYPTLYRYGHGKKPINYVDDVVVPAARIGELIRYLEGYFTGRNVPVAIFGHIGNGNAHILPLLNVNDPSDFDTMVASYRDIHDIVLGRFGGSICGEHGDGRIRAEFLRRMFGDDLYGLFVEIKKRLDPQGVMNPGIKISETRFTEHIDYTRLSKACATCGKCNSVCPVYDVHRSEDMSARGWFEILTAQDYRYESASRMVDACLNCKSCRSVCPAGVDVAGIVLARRAERPNRFAGLIFGVQARGRLFEPLLKLAAWTQPLWDRPGPRRWIERLSWPLVRRLAASARMPAALRLPRLARRHLRDRHPDLVQKAHEPNAGGTAYFHGCAANYFDDGVGDAVIRVLRRLGIDPALPPQRCSGTPIETYGHTDLVKAGARENLRALAPYETVVTGCASCTLMLKDYVRVFDGEPEHGEAQRLAARVKHITEVIAERGGPAMATSESAKTVTYHSSCHLRAAGVSKPPRRVLSRLPGLRFVEMPDSDRCAGGAGTFVVKDYDTSQAIFERKRTGVRASGADVVATSCPACMIQLRNGLPESVDVKHVAQLVDEAWSNADARAADR